MSGRAWSACGGFVAGIAFCEMWFFVGAKETLWAALTSGVFVMAVCTTAVYSREGDA